jgi:CRISPR-associated protein Csd1
MIYQALAELAKREDLLEDMAYEPKPVHYLLVLGENGDLLEVLEPRDPPPLDDKGRPKGKPRAVVRRIPRRSDRTSGDLAEFLVDKAEYVFGIDPKGKTATEKTSNRRRLFRESVDEARRQLPASPGLRAVARFLSADPPDRIRKLLSAEKEADRNALAGAVFAFVYQPDGGTGCVHDEPALKEYFRGKLEEGDAPVGQCLVTGQPNVVLTRLHAKPKGIPPRGLTKGGVPLTSVNADAFKSYGLGPIGGAPISREANLAVEFALNRLLDPAYPRPGGGSFARQAIEISPDTVLVYWTREAAALDFVLGIESRDPEEVAELIRSPYRGHTAPIEDPTGFYALTLSGITGRAIVRSFVHSTVRDVAAAVERYRDEARIARPYAEKPGGFPLTEIKRSLVARGDLDALPPSLGTELYLDILQGSRFPRAVLDMAVRRNRAHDFHADAKRSSRDFRRLGPRCSLLKAYFNRNLKEGITVSLDPARTDTPYRLGRLLAAVDKVQQEALGSINATLVDRYYGAASSTPATIFPTLLRRFENHLGKLRREKAGLAVNRDKLVQEILDSVQAFPTTMGLRDQGLFALGFYHQRQSFFAKKEEE